MSGKTGRGVQHRQASAVARTASAVASIAGAVPALAAGFVASGSAGASPASRAETLIWPEREAESSAPSQPLDPKQTQPDATPPRQPDTTQQLGRKELAVADSDADQLFFTFRNFTLTGSFTLPEAELRALWDRQPGETASVGDIFRFAEAITATYRARGYLLGFALVPPQDIRAG